MMMKSRTSGYCVVFLLLFLQAPISVQPTIDPSDVTGLLDFGSVIAGTIEGLPILAIGKVVAGAIGPFLDGVSLFAGLFMEEPESNELVFMREQFQLVLKRLDIIETNIGRLEKAVQLQPYVDRLLDDVSSIRFSFTDFSDFLSINNTASPSTVRAQLSNFVANFENRDIAGKLQDIVDIIHSGGIGGLQESFRSLYKTYFRCHGSKLDEFSRYIFRYVFKAMTVVCIHAKVKGFDEQQCIKWKVPFVELIDDLAHLSAVCQQEYARYVEEDVDGSLEDGTSTSNIRETLEERYPSKRFCVFDYGPCSENVCHTMIGSDIFKGHTNDVITRVVVSVNVSAVNESKLLLQVCDEQVRNKALFVTHLGNTQDGAAGIQTGAEVLINSQCDGVAISNILVFQCAESYSPVCSSPGGFVLHYAVHYAEHYYCLQMVLSETVNAAPVSSDSNIQSICFVVYILSGLWHVTFW